MIISSAENKKRGIIKNIIGQKEFERKKKKGKVREIKKKRENEVY